MKVVSEALDKAGTLIQDLELSATHQSFGKCHYFSASLRILTLTIEFDDFIEARWGAGEESFGSPYEAALSNTKHLENLEITLQGYGWITTPSESAYTKGPAASLLQALQNASQLRRLNLSGPWMFWQATFSAFIQRHSTNLGHLFLDGVTIGGSWPEMLHDIAEATRDRLEYLAILNPSSGQPGQVPVLEDFKKYSKSQWPDFSCETDFRSSGHLLSELSEEEDTDGEV